ncbi:response regulator [Actinoplanes sp. NPDC023801]|uniref:response regulator n=1 Tax=Actinoplanes sp. NPDC023801 TaxID=3154595 RepID=UPI0033DAFCB1
MPEIGDRIWGARRLLRAAVLFVLVAITVVAVTGLVRNNETLQAQDGVRRSSQILGRIGDLRVVAETVAEPRARPSAGDTLRAHAAGLGALAGSDPVHRDLLQRITPESGAADVRAVADGMARHEQARLDRHIAEAGAVARTNRWMIAWVSVLAALLSLLGARKIEKRLTAVADQIAAAARRARGGDLTRLADVRAPRELGELATAVNSSMTELARARDEASAATAAGSAFLDAMNHEIRTPMTALTGMTGMLLETGLDERQRELATTAHTSGTALLGTVDDLLDLARAETGDLHLERRPFSLRGCVRRALDPVAPAAEAKGLHLSAHLATGCPERVRGDERLVRRILTALLRQAVASTEHGAVTVSVSTHPGGGQNLELRFAIRDTGLGMPADRQSEPGVLLARRLAESMGGGVTTESRPGQGTTVTVTVRVDPSIQPDRSGHHPVAGRKQSLLVLVAEDDPVDQRLTRRLLERRGHRVRTVADGEAALEAVQRDRYDLVLLGSGLLVLDGPTAVRLIHADPPPHGPPRIVAVCTDPEETEDFVAEGVNGVLTRPVDAAELDAVLATAAAYADVRLAGAGPLPGPDDGEPATIRACVDVIAGPDAEPGDRHRLAEILHNFADRLPGLLQRMDEAAADGDTRNLARLAHGLKASSATLGANRFAAICADLEDRAHHRPDSSGEALRDLHERAGEISDTMETISRQLARAA